MYPTLVVEQTFSGYISLSVEWVIKLLVSFYSNTYAGAGGVQILDFRRPKSRNLCVGATCGHECSSEIPGLVHATFLLINVTVFVGYNCVTVLVNRNVTSWPNFNVTSRPNFPKCSLCF